VKALTPRPKILFFLIAFVVGSGTFLLFALQPSPVFSNDALSKGKDPYDTWRRVPFDFDTLRAGDLVVRSGRSFFSNELRKYSKRDKRYSHCALVTIGPGGKRLLLHSIGGSDNPDQVIRCDSIFWFLDPEEVSGFGIYRYNLPPEQVAAIDSLARLYYREKRMFDMKFNLEDDDRLYCAEFVYKVVTKGTGNPEMLSLTRQREKIYVGVDDLYLNDQTQNLFEHEYD
jgi:hypothetical protein